MPNREMLEILETKNFLDTLKAADLITFSKACMSTFYKYIAEGRVPEWFIEYLSSQPSKIRHTIALLCQLNPENNDGICALLSTGIGLSRDFSFELNGKKCKVIGEDIRTWSPHYENNYDVAIKKFILKAPVIPKLIIINLLPIDYSPEDQVFTENVLQKTSCTTSIVTHGLHKVIYGANDTVVIQIRRDQLDQLPELVSTMRSNLKSPQKNIQDIHPPHHHHHAAIISTTPLLSYEDSSMRYVSSGTGLKPPLYSMTKIIGNALSPNEVINTVFLMRWFMGIWPKNKSNHLMHTKTEITAEIPISLHFLQQKKLTNTCSTSGKQKKTKEEKLEILQNYCSNIFQQNKRSHILKEKPCKIQNYR